MIQISCEVIEIVSWVSGDVLISLKRGSNRHQPGQTVCMWEKERESVWIQVYGTGRAGRGLCSVFPVRQEESRVGPQSYCSELLLLLPKSKINLPFPLISYFTRITTIQSAMMTQGENDRLFVFFFTQTIQLPLTQTTPCGCCLQEVLYHSVFFFFLLRPLQIFLIAKETHSCLVSTIENTVFRWLLPQNVPEGQCAIEKSY